MLLGLGFTGAYGANAKAWKSEGVNATTYPDINADTRKGTEVRLNLLTNDI
ncbi:hypothetical protein [Paenibacillus amylolyticus]|uniref:hypothetical protein n=1 Tax=Paenibacillus amylolyticus TaxID=1451 RepID=UPI00286AEC9A|nr:hypothetical protein [Paenibacillus amylolyticus]